MKKRLACALVPCLVLSLAAFSQSTNATVGGTVSDASGALIPGVTITATNLGTGIVTTVVSNEAGAYNFASLQTGTYKVTAELVGFQTQTYNNVQLGGSQQVRLNFALQVGGVAQNVEVTVEADTLLATSSNSVGAVLPEYKVRDLPLAVRDVFGLVGNTGGVQSSGGFVGVMAGMGLGFTNTTRDGINVSDGRYENGAFSVTYTSPDLVEEVKIEVSPVDASASRGAGQVSMVTRSGTNNFRGSAFWANHNSTLDASNWFNNFNNVSKDYDNRNQFGARLGGPIFKNKTFFFVLFEGMRDLKRQQATGITLTDMARQGIFRYFPGVDNANASNANPTVDRNGNPVTPAGATGPLAAVDLFGNCTFNGAPVANCKTYRDPLRSAISTAPYMQETFRRMPSPNEFDGGDGLNTAFIRFTRRVQGIDLPNGNGTDLNRDQYNARIDHNFNSKHKLSVIGTNEKTWSDATQAGLPMWPLAFDGWTVKRPVVYSIQFTSTLTSNLLNQLRMGKKASNNWQWGSADRNDTIGAQARSYIPTANGIPFQVNPTLWTPFVTIGGPSRWRVGVNPMWSIGDDLSWTHGKHAFKGGYEWRLGSSNGFNDDPHYTPITNFGAGANPVTGLDSIGFAGLSANSATTARNLLTDLTASINAQVEDFGPVSAQNPNIYGYPTIKNNDHWNYQGEMSAYFQDNWKFRPDLTLNLGIHWEYYGQPYEKHGLAARVVGGESSFLNVSCTSSPGTPGFTSSCSNLSQVEFVGKNSTHPDVLTNLKGNDLHDFAPAVGLAWDVPRWFGKGKTVLRAGFGLSYAGSLRNYVGVDQIINGVPGVNFGSTGLSYTPPTYTSLSTLSLPVPFPTGTPTTVPFLVPTTARTLSIQTYNRRTQYSTNWNLEIQRELARNTTVEVRYVGTKGSRLWGALDLNQIDAVHRNPDVFNAFNAIRAGQESQLFNQMLQGINIGGTTASTPNGGVVNGTTWTGAMALRTNATTRAAIANGNVGTLLSTLNTLTTGTGSSNAGAVLRKNGFPENYIVPDPQYASVQMQDNLNNSTYHSLQLQFTRRLAEGFTNTTNWTWSRTLGNSGIIRDPSNRAHEKALLSFDHTQQITSNGSYELPFGPNKAFLGGSPSWVSRIVERWQVGGIMNYNTGAPLTVTSNLQTISTTAVLPNVVGAFPKGVGTVTKVSNGIVYFNGYTQIQDPYYSNISSLNGLNSGFSNKALVAPDGQVVLVNPQPGQVGTLGYTTVKGPGLLNFDMDLIKRFRIAETKEFEFRLDAISVLNHPVFGSPNVNMNDTNFGRITSATGARSFVVNTRINF
jgi:hypothetical protein